MCQVIGCDGAYRQGNWLLTDTEQAQLEKEQAEAQLRQAAQNLMAAGMDVNQVAEMLGLSSAQVQAFCQSD